MSASSLREVALNVVEAALKPGVVNVVRDMSFWGKVEALRIAAEAPLTELEEVRAKLQELWEDGRAEGEARPESRTIVERDRLIAELLAMWEARQSRREDDLR